MRKKTRQLLFKTWVKHFHRCSLFTVNTLPIPLWLMVWKIKPPEKKMHPSFINIISYVVGKHIYMKVQQWIQQQKKLVSMTRWSGTFQHLSFNPFLLCVSPVHPWTSCSLHSFFKMFSSAIGCGVWTIKIIHQIFTVWIRKSYIGRHWHSQTYVFFSISIYSSVPSSTYSGDILFAYTLNGFLCSPVIIMQKCSDFFVAVHIIATNALSVH